MPRKHTPDNKSTETEAATVTAAPESAEGIGEAPSFAERVGRKSQRAAMPDPFGIAGDYVAGVHLSESRRDRHMAIKFDEKPSQPILDKLKEAGYRWNPAERVWTHSVRQASALSTRIEAERLYQETREMIRQEKGLETTGIETPEQIPF